jgi:hypothetical protein
MSDELREGNILKLILIVRFACVTLDVGHPLCESPSRLSQVGDMCFPDSLSNWITLLRSVKVLIKLCFVHAKIGALTVEPKSRLTKTSELCFENCAIGSIYVPRAVHVLEDTRFSEATIDILTSEIGAGLREPFQYCSTKPVAIPRSVEIIGKLCFPGDCHKGNWGFVGNIRVIIFREHPARFTQSGHFHYNTFTTFAFSIILLLGSLFSPCESAQFRFSS